MICFQGEPFNITLIQVYAPTTGAYGWGMDFSFSKKQQLKKLKLNRSIKTYKTFWN